MGIIISHTDYKNNLYTQKQIGLAARSVADAKGGWGAHRGVGMFPTCVLENCGFSETLTKH